MVLHMMSYIYSHCRTEGRWLTGVNLQVRTSTQLFGLCGFESNFSATLPPTVYVLFIKLPEKLFIPLPGGQHDPTQTQLPARLHGFLTPEQKKCHEFSSTELYNDKVKMKE